MRPVEVEVVRSLKTAVVDVQTMNVKILIQLAGPKLTNLGTALSLPKGGPGSCGSLRLDGTLVWLILLGQGVEVPVLAHI